jgi:hypothetical protein
VKAQTIRRSPVRVRLASETSRKLALVVLTGVALRLALMPFTLHFDAYQIYSRAHEAAYHNEWFGFTSQFISNRSTTSGC